MDLTQVSDEHHDSTALLLSATAKVAKFWPSDSSTEEDLSMSLSDAERPFALAALRAKYYQADRGEWWWIFDDSVYTIAKLLRDDAYVVVDGFFSTSGTSTEQISCGRATDLRAEIRGKWQTGLLSERGEIVDATDGVNTPHTKIEIRGDYIGWFDMSPTEGWSTKDRNASLPGYVRKVSTLVKEMARFLPGELSSIKNRSRAMVTCYPPGSRYTKHVDNGGRQSNGRRLTTLFYLNEDWDSADGGELAVYAPGGQPLLETVPPIADRLVMFWSDERVPHEVLETRKERFTVTIWFFDEDEWQAAKKAGIIRKPAQLRETKANASQGNETPGHAVHPEPEEAPGDGSFNFVSEDAPLASREPDGSDLRPVVGALALDQATKLHNTVHAQPTPLNQLRSEPDEQAQYQLTIESYDTTVEELKIVVGMPLSLAPPLAMRDIVVDVAGSSLSVSAQHSQLLPPNGSGGGLLQIDPYCVKVQLPETANTDQINAKFSKKKQRLTITIALRK
jgi:Rps23 Pro-64 3,4-dihydroxylase Tpa1-like proline 4-hydroxylase